MSRIMLPIGIERFKELREKQCYYVDKTHFIEELTSDTFKVMLFTRPRRFGKTLTMSMLADFFDIRMDSQNLFKGLEISQNQSVCDQWMNQWPVLFLTMKNIGGLHFESAYGSLKDMISDLCIAHSYLLKSELVDQRDKTAFERLKDCEGSEIETKGSLYTITRMMSMHFGKPVILLMDEYDVPLANASEYGYYMQMLDLIRSLVGKALKTNEFLNFAVITGCLKISKESIFTGTNNFISNSISKHEYSNYFGFTEDEVWKLLQAAGLEEKADDIRKWYNGYYFGNTGIYCPWDVLNHVKALQINLSARPENYWRNTSHNGIIRSFIERKDLAVHDKFETLLSGGCIQEEIEEDMTYDNLHYSEANLWSILYLTGYLTQTEGGENSLETNKVCLKIPNEEIKTIFADTIAVWFKEEMCKSDREALFSAFWGGRDVEATALVTDILFDTISYFDYKEDYYHAFLSGIFAGAGYAVESNHEYGLGRPDIVVRDKTNRRIIVIEAKCSKSEKGMIHDCREAFEQMDIEKYVRQFLKGYQKVLCYSVAFYKKECLVKRQKLNFS